MNEKDIFDLMNKLAQMRLGQIEFDESEWKKGVEGLARRAKIYQEISECIRHFLEALIGENQEEE